MDSNQLYRSHQATWQALTDLLKRADRDIRSLTPSEINRMGQLYRIATSDLALARRDFPKHQVTAYLNQLVARSHAVIYRSEPLPGNRLKRFFVEDFPRAYREMLSFTITAALLFWIPAIIALAATWVQPDSSRWILPAGMQDMRSILENGKLWTDIPVAARPYSSSFIMGNNIQVAITAFGGGLLAGLYTVWVVVLNGLILGGVLGLTAHYGLGFNLLTFIIGHGVIELSVVMMAGGAGLMIGWAIIHPGLLRRSEALRLAAIRAVNLVIGSIPLLFIAGAIEGFISPDENIPWFVKWLVGLGSGIALYSYLFLAGKPSKLKKIQIQLFTKESEPLNQGSG